MDILFWSGGKDAFLALEFYQRAHPDRPLKLLTTYDETQDVVPYQNIALEKIKKQAEAIELELITVALPPKCPNDLYMQKVNIALKNQSKKIRTLIFGDWYLQDIRDWREQQFNELGYTCRFPIWKKSLHKLLPVLLLKPIEVKISSVSEACEKLIRIGETYNQAFVQQLPKNIDPMGENGEFHTEVTFEVYD